MLNGKGFFIWQIGRVEGGDPQAIAAVAQSAGLAYVLLKIADGVSSYNIGSDGHDLVPPVVAALNERGIAAWGWHYVYGTNPAAEASKAIQRIQATGVVGYVIDAEEEYKQPGRAAAARLFMDSLRSALPTFPMALSSYRYPTLHRELPWQEFLSRCDIAMPQVYWLQAHNPGEQLLRSISEYRDITSLPYIPTGAAFREFGWQPTPAEVIEFTDTARAQGLAGVNYWEWYDARVILPDVWNAIAAYNWPPVEPPPQWVRARVWATSLLVRQGPGSSYPSIGSIKQGTRVIIYAIDRGWVKISPGEEHWVYSYYLERIA
jgi:hypothetical protein